jgi:hypothetical protein
MCAYLEKGRDFGGDSGRADPHAAFLPRFFIPFSQNSLHWVGFERAGWGCRGTFHGGRLADRRHASHGWGVYLPQR